MVRWFPSAVLVVLLLASCSSKQSPTPSADGDLTIVYEMKVTGMPMMGDLGFNYQFQTDGKTGRMDTESSVQAGGQVSQTKFSFITDLGMRRQYYVNDATKTYAQVMFPDSLQIPPTTGTGSGIKVSQTDDRKEIAGVDCRRVSIEVTMPLQTGAGGVTNTLTGDVWVSNSFSGYGSYRTFQRSFAEKVGGARLQGSSPLEFLTRFGLGVQDLRDLYEKLDGVPLSGELKIAVGGPQPFEMTAKLESSKVSGDAVDKARFGVPSDYSQSDVRSVIMPQQG